MLPDGCPDEANGSAEHPAAVGNNEKTSKHLRYHRFKSITCILCIHVAMSILASPPFFTNGCFYKKKLTCINKASEPAFLTKIQPCLLQSAHIQRAAFAVADTFDIIQVFNDYRSVSVVNGSFFFPGLQHAVDRFPCRANQLGQIGVGQFY